MHVCVLAICITQHTYFRCCRGDDDGDDDDNELVLLMLVLVLVM